MTAIPLQAVPSQIVSVTLAGQSCRMRVYQMTTGLFLDLYVNDALIVGGVLCLDRVQMVRSAYLGFIGDLAFQDTQGTADPTYDGLGGRFILLYLP